MFETHFSKEFGARWSSLKKALQAPTQKIKVFEDFEIDPASFFLTQQIEVQENEHFLDLCSAPGGKALQFIQKNSGFFTLNESSKTRFFRLKQNLETRLTPSQLRRVRLLNRDGRTLFREKRFYDGILVDAPCSSERHILKKPSLLSGWKPSRIRRDVFKQKALLSSATHMLKPGGTIIYATCSIASEENDGVVSAILKKQTHLKSQPLVHPLAEKMTHGILFLPDRAEGWGPLYIALLKDTGPV